MYIALMDFAVSKNNNVFLDVGTHPCFCTSWQELKENCSYHNKEELAGSQVDIRQK